MLVHCAHDALLPLSSLKPSPNNTNKHSPEQIKQLAKILNYQGWRSPVVVSKLSGNIVAGHGRVMAAQSLGWTEAPVNYQDFEDEDAERAHLTADNAIGHQSELDFAMINHEIQFFSPDFDLELLGIKDFKLDVAEKIPQCDEDETPEPPKEPRSRLGDLYELGNHRLLCGDSTSIDSIVTLMAGEKSDITFTSPPYNLGNNAKLRGYNGDGKDSAYNSRSDHKSSDEYLKFLKDFTAIAIAYSEIAFINIQLLAGNKTALPEYWHHFRNHLVDTLIWDKEHAAPQLAARVLNSVWEFIFAFTSSDLPTRSIDTGPEFRGNIDNIFRLNPTGKKDPLAKNHGAVFPVALAEHFVSKFSNTSVLDLFGGSGSTLIACEKTNRKCFMMEIDPHYIDVIVSRYVKYTGNKSIKLNGEPIEWELSNA